MPYLARLLNQIKYPSVKKTINAALDEAAAKAGMSRGTLDELSVPTHDLDDGRLEIAIGPDGGAAILTIVGTAECRGRLPARRRQGRPPRCRPSSRSSSARSPQARATAKEIEADLTTQIARLQRIWLENRDWSFARLGRALCEPSAPRAADAPADLGRSATGDNRTPAVLVDGSAHGRRRQAGRRFRSAASRSGTRSAARSRRCSPGASGSQRSTSCSPSSRRIARSTT